MERKFSNLSLFIFCLQLLAFVIYVYLHYNVDNGKSSTLRGKSYFGNEVTIVSEMSSYYISKNNFISVTSELAIKSWLTNADAVLLLMESQSMCEDILSKFPMVQCIVHNCLHDDFKIPTVPCLLITGEAYSRTPFIAFTNGDIIFAGSLRKIFSDAQKSLQGEFVLTGKRSDIHFNSVNLSSITNRTSTRELLQLVQADGELHGDASMDYFLYRKSKSLANKMPPFLIGNWRWDNWLLHELIKSETIHLVDSTESFPVLHIGSTGKSLNDRSGAMYNAALFERFMQGLQGVGLGSLKFSDYKFENHRVVPNTSPLYLQARQFHSLAYSGAIVIVVTVPCSFLRVFQNWVALAKQSGIDSFIVFAMDEATMSFSRSNKLSVASHSVRLLTGTEDLPTKNKVLQEMYIERNRFLQNITSSGLGFLSLSANTAILSQLRLSDLLTKEAFGGRLFVEKTTKVDENVWGMSSLFSKMGSAWLDEVIACQEREGLAQGKWSSAAGLDCGSASVASLCLNKALASGKRDRFTYLTLGVSSSSRTVFTDLDPLKNGFYPSIVSIESSCSAELTQSLLGQWNMWTESEDFSSVLPFVSTEQRKAAKELLNDRSPPAALSGVLIRVLTGERPESLQSLLRSLLRVDFAKDVVDIDIFVDYPSNSSAELAQKNHAATKAIAEALEWRFGEKRVLVYSSNQGALNLLLQPFQPRRTGQMLMIIEDTSELSPVFYQWLKTLLYESSMRSDPSLYGVSLARQTSVVGVKASEKFSSAFVDLQLDPSKAFYRYQLFSSEATLLHTAHWNFFVSWIRRTHASGKLFEPCVPFFASNAWYLLSKQTMGAAGAAWRHWFNYYIYMHGYYALYVNYVPYVGADTANASSSLSFALSRQQRGVLSAHERAERGLLGAEASAELSFLLEPPPKIITPPSSYPLYDFFFQYARNEGLLENRWRFVSGVKDKCTTNHPSLLR